MKKKSKTLRVPAKHNPGRGMPTEFPAFISPAEAQMLLRKTDGRAERGPAGLLSFADESAGNHNGGYGSGGSSHGSGGAGTASHGSGGAGQASHGSGSQGGGTGGASQGSHGAGSQGGGSGGASAGSHGAGGPGNNAGGNSGGSRGGQQGGSNVNSGGRPQGAGSGSNFGYGNAVANAAPAGNNFGPRSAMSNSLGVMNQFPGASANLASSMPGPAFGQSIANATMVPSGMPSGLGLQLANLSNVPDNMASPAANGSWSPTGIVGNVKQYDDRISPTNGYMASSVAPNDAATGLARIQQVTGEYNPLASVFTPAEQARNQRFARAFEQMNQPNQQIAGSVQGMPGAMGGATLNRNRIGASLTSEPGAGAMASTAGSLNIGPQQQPNVAGLGISRNPYDQRVDGINTAAKTGFGGYPNFAQQQYDPLGSIQTAAANSRPSALASLQGPMQAGSSAAGQLGQMAQNMPQPAGDTGTQQPGQEPGLLSSIGSTVMDTATGLGRQFVDNVVNSSPAEKARAFVGNMLNQPPGQFQGPNNNPGMTGPGSNAGQEQALAGLLGNGGGSPGGSPNGGASPLTGTGTGAWDLSMYGAQPPAGTGTGTGQGTGGGLFPFNGQNHFGERGQRLLDLYEQWKSQGGGGNNNGGGGSSPGNNNWALYMYGDPNWKPSGLLG